MNVTIVGTGYVGLVTGACLAELGNQVTCVDIDEAKLARLERGMIPIYEPGLENLVKNNIEARRLDFSVKLENSMSDAEIVFIAVDTPSNEDGSADLSQVLSVAAEIGQNIVSPIVVVNKSTVPVGTADKVTEVIASELAKRGIEVDFDVVSNPEFLKEGAAVRDFMSPDRIVIGTDNASSRRLLSELYSPFSRNHDKFQFMGVRDAEMTKYAANAMLATRISFMNEIALVCDKYGVDIENVRRGIGSDSRIGYSFLYAGTGYGGSCFPKDIRALVSMAEQRGVNADLLKAVEQRNRSQKKVLVGKIVDRFGENLSGLKFAIWGLAFKPDTDDVREAPALEIIRGLLDRGASVSVCDPAAHKTAEMALGELGGAVDYQDEMYACIEDADALLVVTEWRQFRQPDFKRIAASLRSRVVFDGRNIYDVSALTKAGLDYVGIGRRNNMQPDQ